MFDELILHGNQIHQRTVWDDKEIVIPIRLPWYRNLAMAVIQSIDITIDGVKHESKDLSILINGEPVKVAEFSKNKKYQKVIWCNLDVQNVLIPLEKPLAEGEHEVHLEFTLDLPYHLPDDIMTVFLQYIDTTKTMRYSKGDN